MQKKTGVMAIILFLLLPYTGSAAAQTPLIQGMERVETAQGPVFYYTIQRGDTLWDLSRKFYNSQWVWPGLWEMNHQIENPHLIYPGNKIRVFLADAMPPDSMPMAQPPEQPHTPVVEASAPLPCPPLPPESVEYTGFIKETPEPILGHILMTKSDKTLFTEGDILFINPVKKNSFIPGNAYHIFSTQKVSLKYDNTRFKGFQHTIKATVTILENTRDYTRAVISRDFRTCSPGDALMAYRPLENEIIRNPSPRPIQARLICSQDNNELLSQGSIAFMDAGNQKRVRPGDIYTLYKTRTAPRKGFKKPAPLPLLKNGTVMVLHTEATASTVRVIYSTAEVSTGDIIR